MGKKAVRFQDVDTLLSIHEIEPGHSVERGTTWLTRSDYGEIRHSIRKIASGSRYLGFHSALEGTYTTNQRIGDLLDDETIQQEQQARLDQWCLGCSVNRGLERWIHSRIGMERTRDKQSSIEAVLAFQSLGRVQKIERYDERLATIYQQKCSSSKVYAFQLALSDAKSMFRGAVVVVVTNNHTVAATTADTSRRGGVDVSVDVSAGKCVEVIETEDPSREMGTMTIPSSEPSRRKGRTEAFGFTSQSVQAGVAA